MGVTKKGVLVLEVSKKGKKIFKFKADDLKPNKQPIVLQPTVICFDENEAVDGDRIVAEYRASGTPVRAVIEGKKEVAKVVPQQNKKTQTHHAKYQQSHFGGQRGGQSHFQKPPLQDATAPYNFIPYDPDQVAYAQEQKDAELFSGAITCSLTALRPLLVCGEQEALAKNEKRFFSIDGQPVVPGSSLKGMIRAVAEVLSFSRLAPLNEKELFFRNFDEPYYKDKMLLDTSILGGFLQKNGAQFSIVPCEYLRVKDGDVGPRDPDKYHSDNDYEVIYTGPMYDQRWKRPIRHCYKFAKRKISRPIRIHKDVMAQFKEQLTKDQKKIWEKFEKKDFFPVFYVANSPDTVDFFGLAKCFRIPYKYGLSHYVRDADPSRLDIATQLFGIANNSMKKKGRVSVSPAYMEGQLSSQAPYSTVLGQPAATCAPHYLIQTKVKRQQGREQNQKKTLQNYNDPTVQIRGRKWYWHKEVDVVAPPNTNENIRQNLYPLDAGAKGEFTVRLDRVTKEELGLVLSTLDLPEGQAHKLGLAKNMGFGSVRVEITECNVSSEKEVYKSLSARLANRHHQLTTEELKEATAAFKQWVVGALPSVNSVAEYDAHVAIATLRHMLLFNVLPNAKAAATMSLHDRSVRSYVDMAILPKALDIPDCYAE